MLIGGHVSIAGGIEKAPERGALIGANVIQIFASSPRSLKPSNYSEDQFVQFKQNAKYFGIEKVFLHGVYLLELATADLEYRTACATSLCQYMTIANKIGAEAVLFHIGSAKNQSRDLVLKNVSLAIIQVLENSPEGPKLLIENSAGDNRGVGSTIEQLAEICEAVGSDRLGFCIDTQHTFAAGNDLRTKEGIDTFLEAFSRLIGWDKVQAIHCNDSKSDLGSGVDRHENIGQGKIGLEAFRELLNHPDFKDLPFILEVPGVKGEGPDKENVDLLKSLIQ